jgi:hypothetical protein
MASTSTRRTRAATTTSLTPEQDIFLATASLARNEDKVVEMLRQYGETDTIKAAITSGYMFQRLHPARAAEPSDLEAIWAARNAPEHKTLYNSARKSMERLRNKAEVVASDNRGGARSPKPGSNDGDGEDTNGEIPVAPPAPPKPKYETEADVRAHFALQDRVMAAFLENHRAITGDQTRKIMARRLKETETWLRVTTK